MTNPTELLPLLRQTTTRIFGNPIFQIKFNFLISLFGIFLLGTYERNDLPFCASTDRMDDTFEFDCANFVSIESQEFINIITRFSNFDNGNNIIVTQQFFPSHTILKEIK